jgi:hypothetical protein
MVQRDGLREWLPVLILPGRFGAALINFAINKLTSAQASYIWCSARITAVGFKRKLGFEMISDEFAVPGTGQVLTCVTK